MIKLYENNHVKKKTIWCRGVKNIVISNILSLKQCRPQQSHACLVAERNHLKPNTNEKGFNVITFKLGKNIFDKNHAFLYLIFIRIILGVLKFLQFKC